MAVNPVYRTHIEEIKKELRKKTSLPSVQLLDFFEKKEYALLKKKMEQLQLSPKKKLQQFSYQKALVPASFFPRYFLSFLKLVLGQEPKQWTAYSMQWKDYRLLHDRLVEKKGTDIILDFSERWPENAGGAIIYGDGEGDVYPLATQHNTLSLIIRKKSFQKYFQYVNHYGKKQERKFIIGNKG